MQIERPESFRNEKFYRVDVQIRTESETGKTKKYVEQYITRATGVTEAEAAVIKNFMDAGDIREYSVIGVTSTKIVDVI